MPIRCIGAYNSIAVTHRYVNLGNIDVVLILSNAIMIYMKLYFFFIYAIEMCLFFLMFTSGPFFLFNCKWSVFLFAQILHIYYTPYIHCNINRGYLFFSVKDRN